MIAADARRGDVVRVLGLYRRHRVRLWLDRDPVPAGSDGVVMLCGYEAVQRPTGPTRRFHVRFVPADEVVA